ncbi:hypothetical protein BJ170DRAFT_15830 [Xylariales sp. AK1849]|nr:hypothetical protein BJ170DRAFT_15830 [Xylariales sp. AK1849]
MDGTSVKVPPASRQASDMMRGTDPASNEGVNSQPGRANAIKASEQHEHEIEGRLTEVARQSTGYIDVQAKHPSYDDPFRDASSISVERANDEPVDGFAAGNTCIETGSQTVPDLGSRDLHLARIAFKRYRAVRGDTEPHGADPASYETVQPLDNNQQDDTRGTKSSKPHLTVSDIGTADTGLNTKRSVSPISAGEPSGFAGGEPGPDMGRWKRVSGHDSPIDYGSNNVKASISRPAPPLCVRKTASRTTLRSNASNSHLRRLAYNPRCTSTRNLEDPIQIDDRPIVITNALDHILYDGTCRHCEANSCSCLDSSVGNSTLRPTAHQKTPKPSGRIMTEGFCRHCVLNNCGCVRDPRWGQHHASNAVRDARFDQSLRILSDTGTVRHYETDATTNNTTNPDPPIAVPPPAYTRVPAAGINASNDVGPNSMGRDVEAQQRRGADAHSVRAFRNSAYPLLPHRRPHDPEAARRGFGGRHMCHLYTAGASLLLLALVVVIVWMYKRPGSTLH